MSLGFSLLLLITCKFLTMFEKVQTLHNPGRWLSHARYFCNLVEKYTGLIKFYDSSPRYDSKCCMITKCPSSCSIYISPLWFYRNRLNISVPSTCWTNASQGWSEMLCCLHSCLRWSPSLLGYIFMCLIFLCLSRVCSSMLKWSSQVIAKDIEGILLRVVRSLMSWCEWIRFCW